MGEWRLGSYELLRRLGEGGMAQVYLARDVRLGREVAVKVLDRKLAARPGFRERFMREARVAAALDHPNIVPLFDFGDAEALYLVMPYVSGGSLQDLLPRAPLPIGEVVTYGSQIADALEYAHQRKLVHRDVKPANMLVHADGRLMLSDFGLAKIVHATHSSQTPRNRPDAGTPEYMAPEQVVGASDARSDIYGLGVVLYLLLTGRLPFNGASSHEVMQAHLYKEPKPVRRYNSSVPVAMEAVVMRAMAKQPAERFQRASELGAALLSALIADNGDAPTFMLGTSSGGASRPTGQIPAIAPKRQAPSELGSVPPWQQRSVDASAAGASMTTSAQPQGETPALSNWDGTRPSAASSLTGILPELNMPFTSLVAPGDAPGSTRTGDRRSPLRSNLSGPGTANSRGSQSASVDAFMGIPEPHPPLHTTHTLGQETLGRIPTAPPAFPPIAPTAAPHIFEPAPMYPARQQQPGPSSREPRPTMRPSSYQTYQETYQAQPVMTPFSAAMQEDTSPRPAPAELRATLPGSRMTDPVELTRPGERRSMLWVIVGILLVVGVALVIILLRWLQAGAAGFMLFAH